MALNKINSIDLADYILAKIKKVDHLKLQKLIYYAEAWHLAYFDNKSLIDDEFEAWVHGPVSRKIWAEFRGDSLLYNYLNARKSFKTIEKILRAQLNDSQLDLINEVIEVYGKYSSFQLEEFTHGEKPWIKARKGLKMNEPGDIIISKNLMGEYYRARIEKTQKN